MSTTGLPTATDRRPDGAERLAVWRACGATADEAAALALYAWSPAQGEAGRIRRVPFPDPPGAAAWSAYAAEPEPAATLTRVLVQLSFPVAAGTSERTEYHTATRRGLLPQDRPPGVRFVRPEGLRIFLHPTPAGRVPVVLAADRADFETLVQAVVHRNEPVPIPASMGACMIAGYNNWDRVAGLRREWERRPDRPGETWDDAFVRLVPQKELYQDRFMLLSSGPYSAVSARRLGLPEDAWRAASIRLRLEHECTHYFTRQAFGAMRKSLLDELVADYMGSIEAFGDFHAERFLLFMGLEGATYREGGRLQNYRGDPPLSEGAFAILQPVARRAARALELLALPARLGPFGVAAKARVVTALTRVGLEGLAQEDAGRRVATALAEASAVILPDAEEAAGKDAGRAPRRPRESSTRR
ncbi:MAG: hypothetical protein ABW221_11885 [Vicinamibacteria bacterium]